MAAGWLLRVTGLIVGLALPLLLIACTEEAAPPPSLAGTGSKDDSFIEVTIKGRVFNLELALDDATRFQGLSDREQIPEDGGMLFVFPDAQVRQFVMRRCLVPIDIAFLDADGEVVWMHAMQIEPDPEAPDYRLKHYSSHYPAQFAIEFREGTIRRLGLKQGDRIDLPLDSLKKRAQ
ncbi:MAG: hypothetical protein Kow00105_12800 [Phycisphaeraceae bacterium]